MTLREPNQVTIAPQSELAYLLDNLSPTSRVWFAEHDSEVVGGIRINTQPGKTGADMIGPNIVVNDVAVVSAHRRHGYGKALMLALEDWLRQQPHLPHTISLAVEASNHAAISLYLALGYELALTDADKDLHIMVKSVDETSRQLHRHPNADNSPDQTQQ